MKYIRPTALILLSGLFLGGCGADTDSGGSAFNPATPVSQTFEDFKIENVGGNSYLSRTIFYDFYRGLEPKAGADDKNTATALRERLNLLMGLTPSSTDATTYVAARNPFDFLHHLINTDQVGSFNDGKRLMYDSITSGAPATYNTPANDALIRLIDGSGGPEPGPDQQWVYPLLDWTSNFSQFEPITATVFRSAQFIARPPAEDETDAAEIQSGFWSGQFNGENFSATGYNQPEFVAFSVSGRQYGDVEFYQAFLEKQYDTLILRDTRGVTIDGKEPAYICALISYGSGEVKVVYVMDPQDDTIGSGSNPDVQCPDVGNSFTYQSAPLPTRQ